MVRLDSLLRHFLVFVVVILRPLFFLFFFFFTTSDYFLCLPLQAPSVLQGPFLLELLSLLASRRFLGMLVVWVSRTGVRSIHQPFPNCWLVFFPDSLYFVLTPGITHPKPLVFRFQSVSHWCGLSALVFLSLGYCVFLSRLHSLNYFSPDWGHFR